jgi:hypothetical protein
MNYPYLRGDGVPVAQPLFQEEGSGSIPTSPLQFHVIETTINTACALNRYWHSRLPMITAATIRMGQHVAYAIEFEGGLYGCAIWSPPVARLLWNGNKVLELRRMALGPQCPKNTATRFLSVMIRDIKRRFPECEKLVSYQDTDVHQGTIYKASNWTPWIPEDRRCRSWNNANRERNESQSTGEKVRWEYALREVPS